MTQQRPVPKTKEELISLLKEQLQSVEDEISGMQESLQNERLTRRQLTIELEIKQKKIKQLIENQSKALGDKVNEGLYNTLQAANQMRAEAEAQLRKFAEDNTILNQKITQKDTNLVQQRMQSVLNSKKLSVLDQKKVDSQRKQQVLVQRKEEIEKDVEMMKKEYDRISREEKQLRGHIQNVKKLKMYLNKHLEGTTKNNIISKSKNSNANDNFWNGSS